MGFIFAKVRCTVAVRHAQCSFPYTDSTLHDRGTTHSEEMSYKLVAHLYDPPDHPTPHPT